MLFLAVFSIEDGNLDKEIGIRIIDALDDIEAKQLLRKEYSKHNIDNINISSVIRKA